MLATCGPPSRKPPKLYTPNENHHKENSIWKKSDVFQNPYRPWVAWVRTMLWSFEI
jgi:hypothetical protein